MLSKLMPLGNSTCYSYSEFLQLQFRPQKLITELIWTMSTRLWRLWLFSTSSSRAKSNSRNWRFGLPSDTNLQNFPKSKLSCYQSDSRKIPLLSNFDGRARMNLAHCSSLECISHFLAQLWYTLSRPTRSNIGVLLLISFSSKSPWSRQC